MLFWFVVFCFLFFFGGGGLYGTDALCHSGALDNIMHGTAIISKECEFLLHHLQLQFTKLRSLT